MSGDEIRLYCKSKGFSEAYTAYWVLHPNCEVCLQVYPNSWRPSQTVHHIKTRGAGGEDIHENLLALCRIHDRVIHSQGDREVARLVGGQVAAKIFAVKGEEG
jgi:hypothetical protein